MTDERIHELGELLKSISESRMDVVTSFQIIAGANKDGPQDGESIADYLHFLMSAIVGPIVCVFGLAGNLLSIVTWARLGMSGSTGRYLTGQAVANLGVLTMFLLCDSIHHWSPAVKYSPAYGEFFSYVGFPIFYLSIVCSIWFTVGVTVDRYVMVCWITKAKSLCSESRATVSLILITLNGFIVNLPHFAYFMPLYPDDIIIDNNNIDHNNNDGNNTATVVLKVAFTETDFGLGRGAQFYEFWIHCIILILVPWISVFFMNVMIIMQLSKANKMMADKKSSQANKKSKESENQITRLLLTVTFTFLFFIGLQCIIQCLWMKKPPGTNLVMISSSFAFGKTGVIFNSSLNFVLYCLTGRRFRVELFKMLGLIKNDGSQSSLLDYSSRTGSSSTSTAGDTGTRGV